MTCLVLAGGAPVAESMSDTLRVFESCRPPLKVLHLLNGEFFSGVEQVVVTLHRYHDRSCVEPKVVCLFDGALTRMAAALGVAVDVMPMRGRFDLRAAWRVARYVRRNAVSIIHAHTLRANLVASLAGRLARVPVAVTIHSPARRETTRALKNRVNGTLERLLVPLTTAYVTVSDSLRQDLERHGVPAARIAVVRNGIDTAVYERGDRAWLRAELGAGERQALVGTVALLRPRKGIEVLLQSVPLVVDSVPEALFVIVGEAEDPGYADKLVAVCHDLGIADRVRFLGFRTDIPDVLAALDAFLLPSLFGEGLPMVVLEAMAAGRPVVATPVEGITEVVTDGVTGVLVPCGDAEALARAVVDLLEDTQRRDRIARSGQQLVRECFSGTAMARQVEQVYRNLALRSDLW
jgi:phosphatidylinositol alpha-mannosyltransferase